MTRKDELFSRLVEAAAALAAAAVVQRGGLTDDELQAMPGVRSKEMADAVRGRLLRKYRMRVAQDWIVPGQTECRSRIVAG